MHWRMRCHLKIMKFLPSLAAWEYTEKFRAMNLTKARRPPCALNVALILTEEETIHIPGTDPERDSTVLAQ